MSAFFKIMLLAVIQGLTEFLPVSSSGHLALARHFSGIESPGVLLEVSLHFGTLLAILVYYRKRIGGLLSGLWSANEAARRFFVAVVVATIPAFAAYVCFGNAIESIFGNPRVVLVMLVITGCILLTLYLPARHTGDLTVWKGLWIGVGQAFALVPGISRSGTTIALARHLGVSPGKAVEFSLLMSVPALLGATVLKIMSIKGCETGDATLLNLAAGAAVAACVGYAAITFLVRTLSSGKFRMFGFYCVAVGLAGLILLSLK